MAGIGLPSPGMKYQKFATRERWSLRTRFLVWGNKCRYVDCPGPPETTRRYIWLPVLDKDSAAEHGVEYLHHVFYRGALQEEA
jgi:hypothetical protein